MENAETSEHEDRVESSFIKGGRALVMVACVIVVIAGLKAAAGFFIPVVTAFFLAVLAYPVMNWMIRRRVPHGLALGLTVLMILVTLGLFVWGGVGLLKSFWQDIPVYAQKAKTYVDEVGGWLEQKGVPNAKSTAEQMYDLPGIVDFARKQDAVQYLTATATKTFGTVASFMTSLGIVLIVMLFLLMEAPGTGDRLAAVHQAGGPNLAVMIQSAQDIQKFLGVKTLISLATGVLAALWCWMFGLKYPLLWGILAFLFNYIPAVGSTAAGLPAIVEALVVHGVGSAVGVGIGYALINFCLDSLLQPMLMGRRFGISGLVVVLSVVFWGWLWHAVGMFLAVPLTMVAKVFLENTDEFRWISVAMAKKKLKHGEVVLETPEILDAELLGAGASTESPRRRK